VLSGYAGWAGSLAPDAVERRLSQALVLSELTSDAFVDALLPTMFATMPTAEDVDRFAASIRRFHPSGFRAMARASAEDLRSILPSIDVPTLLVYGDQDVRAPLPVAEHLHTAVAGAELTVLPDVRHVCNLERPDTVNATVRAWLHGHR
jgi:pimeloyl-ACP methyl ester carboxylesterase